ncbi:MAG: hypothetical protein NTU87_09250 [Verrucomicrobia bacterium]|nr:hypothetical protein [Verrucomicrobiota bacterium]
MFVLSLAAGWRVFVVTRDVKGPMVHNVVKVDANAESMSYLHHVEKFGLGAVAGTNGVALVFLAEVERIVHVVSDR